MAGGVGVLAVEARTVCKAHAAKFGRGAVDMIAFGMRLAVGAGTQPRTAECPYLVAAFDESRRHRFDVRLHAAVARGIPFWPIIAMRSGRMPVRRVMRPFGA